MLKNVFQILRAFPQAPDLIDFNQRDRDRWVEKVARQLPAGSSVLDVGAGPCRYRPLFDHCDYKAHDFAQYTGHSEGVQQETWEYGQLDYISDIVAIPVGDASFDAILCTEVLEHVPEPIASLEEMARILKPGGMLYLTAPLGSGIHQSPYHYYGGYTPYFYRHFLPQFGLDPLEIQPNGGFFKHFLQESARVAWLIKKHKGLKKYGPVNVAMSLVFLRIIPIIFTDLDDDILIDEFTVGFFVTARKQDH
jgi:ubiquinone/menaquinone biosynthesis C-methylase UbiE